MHLPHRNDIASGLQNGSSALDSSKNSSTTATLVWTETVISMLVFLELGQPKSSSSDASLLGEYSVTPDQLYACQHLAAQVEAFTRKVPPVLGGASRGAASLLELIWELEREACAQAQGAPSYIAKKIGGAKEVDPDRIALVNPAGTVYPGDILRGEERAAFFWQEAQRSGAEEGANT